MLDADVVVIGSGFGGAVATLRFAEAGRRVVVLERGDRVSRERFEADPDMFWIPRRHRFGMNDLRGRGRNIIPWLGAAVGGGSHVYAATLKRRADLSDFPGSIRDADMSRYYERGERMLGAERYPDYPPYSEVRALEILCRAGDTVAREHPELVEEHGRILLGISFAPPGTPPGAKFVNAHGAEQRYSDPTEQKILGGDIGSKNSLDLNYLFLAENLGAEIRPLHHADRIEPLDDGGYRVHFKRYACRESGWRRFARHWLPGFGGDDGAPGSITTRRVVIAAGSVGSTEILLRNRDVHGTLPDLGPTLGHRYTTNGDYVSLCLPFQGFFISWLGFAAVMVALFIGAWWLAGAGAIAYATGLWVSRPDVDPDIGTTNSDYIRFRGEDGSAQGAYIEGGRYPTPLRATMAVTMSALGLWKPERYRTIIRITEFLERWVPPFELISRSWPIPLLQMGRDDAVGTMRLDEKGELVIDYPIEENEPYYRYLDQLARLVSRAVGAWWLPNPIARYLHKIEVPHNLGGVPMGDGPDEGIVDDAGRVYAYPDLFVIDGSIIPVALGPNPALTIVALAERAMEKIVGAGGEGV